MKTLLVISLLVVTAVFCKASEKTSQEMAAKIVTAMKTRSEHLKDQRIGEFKDFNIASAKLQVNKTEYSLTWSDAEDPSVLIITYNGMLLKDTGYKRKLSDPKLDKKYQIAVREIFDHLRRGLSVAKNP